jgi:hypothetical protein
VQPHTDIVLVGSSHTRQGYDVKQLEELTGKSAFLVAYNGVDPVAMLPVVRALLADPARRPKMLVIEANCARLSHVPDVEDARLFFDSPPSVKRELVSDYLHMHPNDKNAYLDVFALLANRNNETIVAWPLLHGVMDGLSYHGSYVNKNMPGLDPAAFARLSVPIESDRPVDEQLQALHRIIAVARESSVPLALVDTPVPGPVAAQPRMGMLMQEWQRIARAEGVPYLSGAVGFPTGDSSLFSDSSHLSTAGRELYTRAFAGELPGLMHSAMNAE